MIRGVVLALMLLFAAVPAWAKGMVALVIGNKDYAGAPLKNPLNDARDVAAALRKLGFSVVRVENAGLKAMLAGVRRFQSEISPGGIAVAYYSGHGLQVDGQNYLLPVDASVEGERELQYAALRADDLLRAMDEAKARTSILILDACRNNPFQRRFRSAGNGLALMNAAAGTLIAYATAPGAVASDGTGRNGQYTSELLKVLGSPGLPVEQMFKQVRVNVAAATRGQQVPWESSSLTGDFCFAGCGGEPPPRAVPPANATVASTVLPAATVTKTTPQAAPWGTFKPPPPGTVYQTSTGGKVTVHGADPVKRTLSVSSGRGPGTWLQPAYFLRNDEALEIDDGALAGLWPLEVGKTVRFTVIRGGDAPQTWINQVTVLREENLKVAGAVHNTFVVERHAQSRSGGYEAIHNYWYSPDLGLVLRYTINLLRGTSSNRNWQVTSIDKP